MSARADLPDDLLQYVEDVGLAFESFGGCRMMGRVLGWLLVADPPHQTFAEIADALGKSKGSISHATRALIGTYAHNSDALIAASQVIAIHYQTIAAANNYWRD